MMERSRLESMLGDLAGSIDWPIPSPDVTTRVVAQIESQPGRSGRPGRRRLALAMAAVALISGLVALSPSARQAVADLLGTAGIRIGVTSEPAPLTGADLRLGDQVEMENIRQQVDFEVRVPVGGPGPPDGVYLSEDAQVLSMVWSATGTLPAAGGTDVGLLLTQRKAQDYDYAVKALGPRTEVRRLSVEGRAGVWIEGALHSFTLLDAEEVLFRETTRLAANVLLWEANGVDHRLETTGDLESALAIVELLESLP